MMTRGEVALIVAQKGLGAGFLTGEFFSADYIADCGIKHTDAIILKLLYAKDIK